MLNLEYKINLNKNNIKFLKNTQLTLLYLFQQIVNKKPKLIILSSSIRIKTLMMSPFHYKVAKKNIKIPKQYLKLMATSIKFNEKLALFFILNYSNILNLSYLSLIECSLLYKFKQN